MNLIAHFYVAEITETSFVGSLLGDFKTGQIDSEFSPKLNTAIHLHRQVDSFADNHPLVRKWCIAFDPPFRRGVGIALDLWFDYLLLRDWDQLVEEVNAEEFIERVKQTLLADDEAVPRPVIHLVDAVRNYNLLESYAETEGIRQALLRIERRLSGRVPLVGLVDRFQEPAVQQELSEDFHAFFRQLLAHVRNLDLP